MLVPVPAVVETPYWVNVIVTNPPDIVTLSGIITEPTARVIDMADGVNVTPNATVVVAAVDVTDTVVGSTTNPAPADKDGAN
jgi:hypothetical protein